MKTLEQLQEEMEQDVIQNHKRGLMSLNGKGDEICSLCGLSPDKLIAFIKQAQQEAYGAGVKAGKEDLWKKVLEFADEVFEDRKRDSTQ
jgi:hypothetical protein